jgi:hypothetical protein
MSTTDIPPGVRALLWLRAGGRCQFEGCNNALWRDGLTTLPMNASQIAHIVSDSPGGPRGDPTDSPRLAKNVTNLMLLCLTHHKLVDLKEYEASYPRAMLEHMKEVHEHRIELMTSIHGDKRTRLVTYWANVGDRKHFMSDQAVMTAVLPNGYPTSPHPLHLAMANSQVTDGDDVFWSVEKLQLDRQFSQLLKPDLGTQAGHISLFGIAPQPLLIYLGFLISDLVPTEVYQLHREPQDWSWRAHADGVHPMPVLERSGIPSGTPCLVIAISAEVATSRIDAILGPDLDLWTITVDGPHNDVMQSREQLAIFRRVAREALEGLSQAHAGAEGIHVFPVAPVSACIELGRVVQPRACLPLVVYNQTRSDVGFTRAIRISGLDDGGKTQ